MNQQRNYYIKLIVVVNEFNVLGLGPTVDAWRLADHERITKEKLLNCTVIMEEAAAQRLDEPFPNCQNIVVSERDDINREGFTFVKTYSSALEKAKQHVGNTIWVLAGTDITTVALSCTEDKITDIHITELLGTDRPVDDVPRFDLPYDLFTMSPRFSRYFRVRKSIAGDGGNTHNFDMYVYQRIPAAQEEAEANMPKLAFFHNH